MQLFIKKSLVTRLVGLVDQTVDLSTAPTVAREKYVQWRASVGEKTLEALGQTPTSIGRVYEDHLTGQYVAELNEQKLEQLLDVIERHHGVIMSVVNVYVSAVAAIAAAQLALNFAIDGIAGGKAASAFGSAIKSVVKAPTVWFQDHTPIRKDRVEPKVAETVK